MPSKTFSTFTYGLDTRRSILTSVPGTLAVLNNGHVNQGAEIEKRKAFIASALPANTFGLESLSNTLVVFGSIATPGGLPAGVIYQQLIAPSASAMAGVVSSTSFGNKTFVIASYADGSFYAFYDTKLVVDFVAGIGDIDFTSPTTVAADIVTLINRTSGYTAVATGGGLFNITSLVGSDFTVSLINTSASGAMSDQLVSNAIKATPATPAVGQFQIVAGSSSAFASNKLTGVSTDITAGNTVTIGKSGFTKVYTFVTTIGTTEGNVLKGGTTASSLQNLVDAINHNPATAGVNYVCAAANPYVTATVVAGVNYQIMLTSILAGTGGSGQSGNNIATVETSNLTFSSAKLIGGTDNAITAITANDVSLLGANVPFNGSIAQTATDVAVAINAYNISNDTGFTASSANGTVIISSVAQNDTANGGAIVVTVIGNVCTGTCSFVLGGTGFTISSITDMALVALTSGALTFPTNGSTLALFNAALVANINARTGTSGYVAFTDGVKINISKKVSSSADSTNNIIVNGTATTNFTYSINGVSGGGTIITMTAVASPSIQTAVLNRHSSGNSYLLLANPLSVLVTNGTPPYTYLWSYVIANLETVDSCRFTTEGNANTESVSYSDIHAKTNPTWAIIYHKTTKPTYNITFFCIVTDGNGYVVNSNSIIVTVPEG